MKILCWNVNGIRACAGHGFLDWFAKEEADVVCIQETKAHEEQLTEELARPLGYHAHWHSAHKKGYSGVATFSKRRPRAIQEGLGIPALDKEGRVLITEFPGFVLINAYFPNSQHDHARLNHKIRFQRAMRNKMDEIRASGRNVIVCGDYNIAHRDIDLANPVGNRRNAGFLPQERSWMERTTRAGYIDAFRHFCEEPGHYTWWSYRAGVRERNVGWRIDVFLVNPELKRRLRRVWHQTGIRGSDHCPIALELR